LSISLSQGAVRILETASPREKVRLTKTLYQSWQSGEITAIGSTPPPNRPARPDQPVLCSPRDMPRRTKSGTKGRAIFIHAIAHIELNAIDLAWDMVARFGAPDADKKFYDDWIKVALDEATHFQMLSKRLQTLGFTYGDFPAHDGLWEAAIKTSHSLQARLAMVPMTLEARGLDTTGQAIHKLRHNGDNETADILQQIAREEIPHVAAGVYWFKKICHKQGQYAPDVYHFFIRSLYKGRLKQPFNQTAREQAKLTAEYYLPVSD